MSRLWLLWIAVLLSCSDAHLYGKLLDDTSPDRLGMTGEACTEDARQAGFEVKVVFLIDTAFGPMFTTFDPELARLRALSEAVQRHAGNSRFSFAVASFGPYARKLAPLEPGFTQNPGELENGIATAGLGQGCLASSCRDYEDGLGLARSIIEGDLADLTAGQRVRTQYVIALMAGGAPDPIETTWDDTVADLVAEVADLRGDVEEAGALSFSLHTLFMAAPDTQSPTPFMDLDLIGDLLQQLSLVGAGRFERFDSPDEATLDRVGLLRLSALLQFKSLVVSNVSALPTPGGAVPDSDFDGIADEDEPIYGSDPLVADTDGDGIRDGVETLVSLDPTVIDDPPSACEDLGPPPWGDADTDLMNDCEEALLGTDASLPDSDGDALPDWLEVVARTDYLQADLLDDADWDGSPNGDEVLAHTDPVTSDANSHLARAYRYEVTDLGYRTEPSVGSPHDIQGVRVLAAGPDSVGGLGTLRWVAGNNWLRWKAPLDEEFGPRVDVADGTLRLRSGDPDLQRWIDVEVTTAQLPPTTTEELLLVELSERNCVEWTVRNVKLVETDDGFNDVFLYFAEAPQGQLTRPGLFRLAHLPVHYDPETGRDPSEPLVEIRDEEFVSIGN